jgi:hypothetical protein
MARDQLMRRRKNHVIYEPSPKAPRNYQDSNVVGVVYALRWAPANKGAKPEPWLIRGLLHSTDGPIVLSALVIEHRDDPTREVTGTLLRGIDLAAIRDEALRWAAGRQGYIDAIARGGYLSDEEVERVHKIAKESKHERPRGRRGYPTEHYKWIAHRYLALVKAGHTANVLKVLAEQERVPRETVRDWVRKATKLGYLEPGQRGKVRTRPGPNLRKEDNNNG